MQYHLGSTLQISKDNEPAAPNDSIIEIMTLAEFKSVNMQLLHQNVLIHSMENIQYCKAETFGNCILGTITIPNKKNLLADKTSFGYYMTSNRLIFIDNKNTVLHLINKIEDIHYDSTCSIGNFFAIFLDQLIQEDVIYLQQFEQKLTDIEDELLTNLPKGFYHTVILCRKELLALYTYYEQLTSLGEELQFNSNHQFIQSECDAFGSFSNRASRLHSHVEMLREYVLQIREMYQSQIDISQTRTMNLLTIVTTIFFPLSIIVGWYGMNFTTMPELSWKYGYLVMICVSILIIILEFIYFRKKKLL